MRLSPRSALLLLAAGLTVTSAFATGDKTSRYPFDPVCPWGRLANGKGMIHRCISEDEARSLATEADENAPKKDESGKKPGAKPEPKPEPLPTGFDLSVGPITASQGSITVGRLHIPMDRYRECIDENGGLTKPTGRIVVKFLVRAERLRAEGASVASQENVSKKAAECVAAVVDRRKVGTPSVPMTEAKLTFSLRQKK